MGDVFGSALRGFGMSFKVRGGGGLFIKGKRAEMDAHYIKCIHTEFAQTLPSVASLLSLLMSFLTLVNAFLPLYIICERTNEYQNQ